MKLSPLHRGTQIKICYGKSHIRLSLNIEPKMKLNTIAYRLVLYIFCLNMAAPILFKGSTLSIFQYFQRTHRIRCTAPKIGASNNPVQPPIPRQIKSTLSSKCRESRAILSIWTPLNIL